MGSLVLFCIFSCVLVVESLLQSFLGSSSQLRELEWIQSVQKWTVKYRQREVEGARSLLEQGLLHRVHRELEMD